MELKHDQADEIFSIGGAPPSITPPKLDFRENLKSFIMMNLEHYAKKQQK